MMAVPLETMMEEPERAVVELVPPLAITTGTVRANVRLAVRSPPPVNPVPAVSVMAEEAIPAVANETEVKLVPPDWMMLPLVPAVAG
jgi:hypothetical protein